MNKNDPNFSMSERDLLIRLDANVSAMRVDMQNFAIAQDGLNERMRTVETAVTILSPTPGSPSHAELVGREAASRAVIETHERRLSNLESALQKYVPDYVIKIDQIAKDMQLLKDSKNEIVGGWKGLSIIFGVFGGIVGGAYALVNLVNFFIRCGFGCK